MTLQMENEQTLTLGFDQEAVARQVIDQVLDMEQCPYEAEVSLTLTDNQEIHRLNREFRQIDRATDVLSFPMVDFPTPASYDFLEEAKDCFDPDSGELLLGDIVISVERAQAQALEYGHSLLREYAFLIAHSMLHLLGYDHMTPEEAAVMEEKQEAALAALGITREEV
jgi:probable rRNA maturation factor